MKATLFILAVVLAGFWMGCQEAQMTGPEAGSGSDVPSVSKSFIPSVTLSGLLPEPSPARGGFTEVNGQVTYSLAVVPLDPIPPQPQFLATLDLITSAELRPSPLQSQKSPWRISVTSRDIVPLFENGDGVLDRSYTIEGRTDGVRLHLRLRITLTGVTLAGMWLEASRTPAEAGTY